MITKKIKFTKKTIISIVFFILLISLIVLFLPEIRVLFTDANRIREYIQGFGALGPIVLILFTIFQVIIWPIPGYIPVLVGSYLYDFWGGFLYTLVGINIGTYIVLLISRKLGRPFVEKFIKKESLDKWDKFINRSGPFILFLTFLIPGFPDDLICYAAGLTNIPIALIVALSIIGRAPQNANIAYFGEAISLGNIQTLIIPALLIGAMGLISLRNEKKIIKFIKKIEKKVTKKLS